LSFIVPGHTELSYRTLTCYPTQSHYTDTWPTRDRTTDLPLTFHTSESSTTRQPWTRQYCPWYFKVQRKLFITTIANSKKYYYIKFGNLPSIRVKIIARQ